MGDDACLVPPVTVILSPACAVKHPTSGYATTFGKLLTGGTGTYSSFATMKMYDDGPDNLVPPVTVILSPACAVKLNVVQSPL